MTKMTQVIWGGGWKPTWEPLVQLNQLSRAYFESKFGSLVSCITKARAKLPNLEQKRSAVAPPAKQTIKPAQQAVVAGSREAAKPDQSPQSASPFELSKPAEVSSSAAHELIVPIASHQRAVSNRHALCNLHGSGL